MLLFVRCRAKEAHFWEQGLDSGHEIYYIINRNLLVVPAVSPTVEPMNDAISCVARFRSSVDMRIFDSLKIVVYLPGTW